MPLPDPQVSAQIGTLQSLDDAIAYRLDRLSLPCPDCRPGARCAEHSQDEHLIGLDPADIELIMRPGDDTPPTAGALSLVVMARLRERAASGPVLVDLDRGPVIYEANGPVLIEHPMLPGNNDS